MQAPQGQTNRQRELTGLTFALAAAVCYASTSVLARHLVTQFTEPLIVSFLAALVGIMVMGVYSSKGIRNDRHAPKRAFMLMALAGAAASFGITSNFFALSHAPVATVAPILAISPLISMLLSHVFLQRLERVTLRLWIGAMFIVAGISLVALSSV